MPHKDRIAAGFWLWWAVLTRRLKHRCHVLRVLDQKDGIAAGSVVDPLTQRALDLRVPGMSDQDHVTASLAVAGYFHMHLGHQWTGRVEDLQSAVAAGATYSLGNTVRRKDDGCVVGNLVQFVDENSPRSRQAIHHVTVVHDLMADVDGCTVKVEHPFDDFDRSVDTGAESAGVGEKYVHGGRR